MLFSSAFRAGPVHISHSVFLFPAKVVLDLTTGNYPAMLSQDEKQLERIPAFPAKKQSCKVFEPIAVPLLSATCDLKSTAHNLDYILNLIFFPEAHL